MSLKRAFEKNDGIKTSTTSATINKSTVSREDKKYSVRRLQKQIYAKKSILIERWAENKKHWKNWTGKPMRKEYRLGVSATKQVPSLRHYEPFKSVSSSWYNND